jgi:Bacterial Ig-like domain (group 3)/Putative Ig domain/Galactose oxidase, central domain/Kelch motif
MGSQHAYNPEDRMFPLSQPWKISISTSRGRGLALLALAGFACATILSVASFAQSNPPLNFGNNFFVTGDYVVAGAQGLNASFGSDGLGTGIISIPDGNPGIRGTTTVPTGANIVAALLYWQTVEKVGVMPGQPGSGQNGFFGPVFNNVPHLYAVSGQNLPSQTATSFSNGGCSGTSTGKLVRTYRADVRGFLPLDTSGNALVDSAGGVTFEVRLPNVGNNTPLTLGATLVLVYRVISPNFPLNVITIYDGGFAPNATPNFTMSLPVQGFYQADKNPVSRLTHIVGAGKSNKFQQAYLSGGQNGNQRAAVALPSPYGIGQPAFPGHYTNWDNTTWVFPDPTFPNHPNLANPLQENDDSATAMVVASGGNPGCVSWGATIVSTTIHDDDKDGIPPVLKSNKGYTDPATGQFVSLADPNDPPATGQQDIFIQMDHVVDVNGDFTPDPLAVSMVKSAFHAHNIHLHITDASKTTSIANANIIQEPGCTDQPKNNPPYFCPYPNQPGVTTWRYGFEFVKNQPVNYPDETSCDAAANGPCVRRFPIAQRNSHHYVVFGDTLGADNWTFFAGKLTDSTGTTVPGTGIVKQVNNTVTFQTSYGHGLTADNAKHTLPNGRVTVSNAITNPNLNGTFFVTGVSCPGNDCSVTNTAAGPYVFTINIGGNRVTANYTTKTDPYLAVASGQATSGSGLSDIGGMGTLVTLGKWGANATLSAKAGTLMHELGHTFGLSLHGGSFYDNLAQNPNDYRPTIEPNCKSNYQSVMNYMFQARLLGASVYSISQTSLFSNVATYAFTLVSGSLPQVGQNVNVSGTTNGNGIFNVPNKNVPNPVITSVNLSTNTFTVSIPKLDVGLQAESNASATMISTVDFSRQQLSTLDETNLGPITTTDPQIAFHTTDWYDKQTFVIRNGQKVALGTAATHHCDDSPLNANDVKNPTYFYSGGTSALNSFEISIPWSSNSLDANFDGTPPGAPGNEPPKFRGYNDWANVDPRQTGGTGSSLLGPGGLLNAGPGGLFGGPGGLFGGPGGLFGGPGGLFGGPGGLFGGPGGLFGGPGGLFGGPGELNFANAISVTPPPTGLSASEGVSPRTITLTWTEPNFPATDHNNIYRSPDGVNFTFLTSVPGTAPGTQNTFTDTVTCNPNGYSYFATEVVNVNPNVNPPQFQESTQSNIVSTGSDGLLTGCYVVSNFSSPANAVQGSSVQVTWTLTDDFNTVGNSVTRQAANTLVAIGPLPGSCATGRTTLLADGVPTSVGVDTFTNVANQFTFTWNNTDAFCAGSYTFELDLDHVPASPAPVPAQVQTTTSALQLSIDVNDTDSNPHVTTLALTAGTVGLAYGNTLTEDGGTAPFKWTFTSSLPPGISQQSLNSSTLSGTTCAAGTYNFAAMVTDSKSNSGLQALTLQINKANTTTGVTSNANPSVFQQMVTFTVTVAPQYTCTPTGTVTLLDGVNPIASNLALSGGMATYTTSTLSVGIHQITASYGGDPNFNSSNSAIWSQTVNQASTTTTISSVSPSPAVVGQAITVAYTLAVVPPGAGTPIVPTGTVTVASSDGSVCAVPAAPGPGMCTLSPVPATAGNWTFTVTYSGDNNFLGSPANGNYTVLIFVSDTAPPPFTATTTLPNAVLGAAYSNTVYESGGVTTGSNNFSWTIVPNSVMPGGGSTLSGLSFQPNSAGVTNGTLSGTPTSAGTFTFTAMVSDSAGNTGTQAFTIAVNDNVFASTGNLGTARWTHTATLLNSAKTNVLVTGGNGAIVTLTSAELYDPSFSSAGSMNVARSSHTATLLQNGTILLAGGITSSGSPTNTAEIYDPAAGTFTATAGSMTVPRAGHTATLLGDGTVLIAGGSGDTSAEIFNPATGTFAATTNSGTATTTTMTAARRYHTATLLSSGQVLLAGGEDSSLATKPTLASAEVYDPGSQTFAATGSLATSRVLHSATSVGGTVYVIGGESGSTAGYVFLNSVESFTGAGFNAVPGALNTARTTHTATLLQNGSILIAGGFGAIGAVFGPLSSAELFNPITQTSSLTGSLATARYFHTATQLNDGTVLVVGGLDVNGSPLSSAEIFYPAPPGP